MIALALLAAVAATRDWRATLLADARALHNDIRANHPGPVNAADPGFVAREAAAYAKLRGRAAVVRDITGYRFALKAYIASFDDGHVQFWIKDMAALPTARWPGFLTGYDGAGVQRVLARAADAPVPLGAELKGCDGVPAATLATRRLGAFEGRWRLSSFRAERGGLLLVDRGNPFVRNPTACDFQVSGTVRRVTLAWAPIAAEDLNQRLGAVSGVTRPPIGARVLADGTRWYGLSDFEGAPDGPAAKALVPLIDGMRADRAALARAPAIVLDLRGNGGGSSDWSARIARVLWGARRVAALGSASKTFVEWRASPDVIAAIDAYLKEFGAAPTPDSAILTYFRTIGSGLRQARAADRPLWREPPEASAAFDAPPPTGTAPDPPPLAGPVYVLTDAGCASACLDAVDLWRGLGAVQIGRETSADTFYLDVREGTLPSGLAGFAVPMKVYRQRERGSNMPWAPVHLFTGDITDTPALERWVASLPERQ